MAPVQQVPLEVQLAQGLAGNEPGSRDKTFEILRKFIRLQLPHLEEPLKQADFIKIWKGIHYRLWMQDKPLLQEKLVEEICELLSFFPTEEYAMMYIRSFYETEVREWNGIDQLRLDKYMMLIREFVNSTFVFLSKSGWKVDLIKKLNVIIEETVFSTDTVMQPISLQLHLIDIYPLELKKVINEQFNPDIATHIFTVFVNIFPILRNSSVVTKLLKLLHNIIFDEVSPEDKKNKKRYVLNGIEERDATMFENPMKLVVDQKQFLILLMDTASNERGSFKRRNQLYSLIKKIKSVELKKKPSKNEDAEKKLKKSIKQRLKKIKDVDIDAAAVEYLEFKESLSSKIPSQKEVKRLEKLLYLKKRDQEKLDRKQKKKTEDIVAKEEEAKDKVEESGGEGGEDAAAEFIEFEAGDDDGDDDDEYDVFDDGEVEEDSFIVDDDEEEDDDCDEEGDDLFIVDDEEDEDASEEEDVLVGGSGGEEERGELSDSEVEEGQSLAVRKKQKTCKAKKKSVSKAVISDDDDDDDGYDDENEVEDGSDDGLEYDAEEAFMKMEENGELGEEGNSSTESNEEDSDDVGCYIVDVNTDNSDGGGKAQDNQITLTETQTIPLKKAKKNKGDGKSAPGKCKRKNLETDNKNMIKKKMKMMMDMMMSETETSGVEEKKQKKKKTKKNKKAKEEVSCNMASITDVPSQCNIFTTVDFEEDDGLVKMEAGKKETKTESRAQIEKQDEEKTTPNRKKRKKSVNSDPKFPLPVGLESSPNMQVVFDQLRDSMDNKPMRRTEIADKRMKNKLNRYFDMVAKSKLLSQELVSNVPNGNEEPVVLKDGEEEKVKKHRNRRKSRGKKITLQEEDLTKFCESPPAFFQLAVSKVKKPSKKKTPKPAPAALTTESLNDNGSLDRKSVSFDMKLNKAFLPETPIRSETPFNSQKKPKNGILKPSPSPILVRKQKKNKVIQVPKRLKASDFF